MAWLTARCALHFRRAICVAAPLIALGITFLLARDSYLIREEGPGLVEYRYVSQAFVRTSSSCDAKPTEPFSRGAGITLVTHLSLDRLPHLVALCHTWRGPISVGVFIRHSTDVTGFERAFDTNECFATYASLHYVLLDVEDHHKREVYDPHVVYPFNHLRNLALDGARTEYVLLLDADFTLYHEDTVGPTHAAFLASLCANPEHEIHHSITCAPRPPPARKSST
ncbi:hypothetical protein CYMTET_27832 [Cymbomonas tetramitiformis]|uniref:Hexosyltransferase n=1 Tax=Cymbomonas tetramitiformis TaxID=36881 RepID=A0AAE0KWS6_9CHLO|nr:hypothetical protein CYMTET_27832 [Cymbomonas tetramitiformis]